MRSPIRAASAALLALALVTLPLALDHCSAFCDTHQSAVASAPGCHHTASTTGTVRVGRSPTACGHHHTAISAKTAAESLKPDRVFHRSMVILVAGTAAANAASEFVLARRLPDHSLTS